MSNSRSTTMSAPAGIRPSWASSDVSRIAVPAARSGSQIAGLRDGGWLGSQGKAQAPSPGQTLPFCIGLARIGRGAFFRGGKVALILGITTQEFLREIGKIVPRVVFGGGWRPPRRPSRHPTLRLARANRPSPAWSPNRRSGQVALTDQAYAYRQATLDPQSPLSAQALRIREFCGRADRDSPPASSSGRGRDDCRGDDARNRRPYQDQLRR